MDTRSTAIRRIDPLKAERIQLAAPTGPLELELATREQAETLAAWIAAHACPDRPLPSLTVEGRHLHIAA